jgi:hypothetical protein
VIFDLHAHYPMHLVPPIRGAHRRVLRSARGRGGVGDRARAELVGLASLVLNYRFPWSGPRVRVDYMRAGGVGVALSVLYAFFDEIDVGDGPCPRAEYLETLERQIELVEATVAKEADAVVAHEPGELAAALRDTSSRSCTASRGATASGRTRGPSPTRWSAWRRPASLM